MKNFIIFSLALSALNCHNVNSSQAGNTGNTPIKDSVIITDAGNNETLAGEWQLQPVLASDTASGKIPKLKFNVAAHSFSGFSGCNGISGSFLIKGETLSFNEQVVSTEMACPGYNEKIFMDNLLKTNRYQVKQGVLQLMYNTTILSNWVRHADTTTTKQV